MKGDSVVVNPIGVSWVCACATVVSSDSVIQLQSRAMCLFPEELLFAFAKVPIYQRPDHQSDDPSDLNEEGSIVQ